MTPPAQGWYVEVDHPTTGHTHAPDILETPSFKPSINDLPRLSVPVPRDEKWRRSWADRATMRAWFDGERLPIDELASVSLTQDAAVLEGIGGTELRSRVTPEYDVQEIHTAGSNLVTNNTGYTANFDTPPANREDGVDLQDPDLHTEWADLFDANIADTDPIDTDSAGAFLELLQSCEFLRTDDLEAENGATKLDTSGNNWEDDDVIELATSGERCDGTVLFDYDIPAENVEYHVRLEEPAGTYDVNFDFDNTTIATVTMHDDSPSMTWFQVPETTNNLPRLEAGTAYSVEVEAQGTDSGDKLHVDCIVILDNRYTYTFDNSTDANDQLSGPEEYPDAHSVESADTVTVRNIVGNTLSTSFDNTENGQEIAFSPDQGTTWYTQSNSNGPLDQDYADRFVQARVRLTLSRYQDDPDNSPATGDAGQTVDSYDFDADLDEIPIAVEQQLDGQLIEVLRELADQGDFVFAVEQSGSTTSVEWTRPGQRTSTSDPEVVSYEVTRSNRRPVDHAWVHGRNRQVRDEQWTANVGTWVALNEDWIEAGTERVYDDSGTVFTRGTDYEMIDHYRAGEIKALSGGSLTDGTTYNIDYVWRPTNDYDNGAASPVQDSFSFPAITTERQAGLAAVRLVDVGETHRWQGRAVVPTSAVGFSVVEDLDASVLPTGGETLHMRDVERTPEEVVILFENRQSIADTQQDINQRFRAVERTV